MRAVRKSHDSGGLVVSRLSERQTGKQAHLCVQEACVGRGKKEGHGLGYGRQRQEWAAAQLTAVIRTTGWSGRGKLWRVRLSLAVLELGC